MWGQLRFLDSYCSFSSPFSEIGILMEVFHSSDCAYLFTNLQTASRRPYARKFIPREKQYTEAENIPALNVKSAPNTDAVRS